MKKTLLYLLMFSIVFQSFSNLWIISAFYVQRDYISKNLCINRFDKIPTCKGACYLEKKLVENEKKEQKVPTVKEKEVQLYCQHFHYPQMNTTRLSLTKRNPIVFPSQQAPNPIYFSIFHPPCIA